MLSLLAHNKEFKEPKKSTIKTIWKTTNNENKQIISSCTDLNYQNDFHDSITKYNTNIIIVPFGIIKQWEKSINLQTNLNYYLINKTIHINNLKRIHLYMIMQKMIKKKNIKFLKKMNL